MRDRRGACRKRASRSLLNGLKVLIVLVTCLVKGARARPAGVQQGGAPPVGWSKGSATSEPVQEKDGALTDGPLPRSRVPTATESELNPVQGANPYASQWGAAALGARGQAPQQGVGVAGPGLPPGGAAVQGQQPPQPAKVQDPFCWAGEAPAAGPGAYGAQPQGQGAFPVRPGFPPYAPAQGFGQPQVQPPRPPSNRTSTSTSTPFWGGADLSVLDKEKFFEELKTLYRKKVLPLELSSRYAQFHSAALQPSDFDAKPMVLLLGQYSVGKTSFIRSLLRRDFPGQRVGPEPTTDRFMAIMHGHEERLVPGHALAMQADKPFRGLAGFGNNFLTKFEAAEVPAAILRNVTLIDSPGILSGEKQRIGRDYDYQSVIQWFADRADLIIIMFDAHKLDISDELRTVMDALRVHQDKIRILLNKADTIDSQQLMRVYGALMWSLGKVVNTPEVCRVYIGSFWEHPLQYTENRLLLEREKQDLLNELGSLPGNAVIRRINELVKRARSVKVHAYLIHYLRKQIPMAWGKGEKHQKLISRLDKEFVACARRYNLPLGDFPEINKFRARLMEVKDLRSFPKLDKTVVYDMDKVFAHDIPKLLSQASAKRSHK